MKTVATPSNPLRVRQCLHLGIVLTVTAATCLLLEYRLKRVGGWTPTLPVTIGTWEAVTVPLTEDARNALGGAPTENREYRNPLEDHVAVQVVVPKSFDAYREPAELTKDFMVSAQRVVPLFGPEKPVRAWIWKPRYSDKGRVMMLCWIQERSGSTRLFGLRGLQQTFTERLQISLSSLASQPDRCIIRLYTFVHSADTMGVQARRNLEEVARGIYAESTRTGATP